MKLTLALVLGLLVLPALGSAQTSVDGKWVGEVQGGRGPQTLTIMLKAEGGKLSGTIEGGRGGPVTIEDGTYAGGKVAFKTKQQGRGGEVVFSWSGAHKGDEIAFTRTMEGGQGQAQEFVAKRQK